MWSGENLKLEKYIWWTTQLLNKDRENSNKYRGQKWDIHWDPQYKNKVI